MGNDRAAVTSAQPTGTAAEDWITQGCQCVALYGADRLPVATVAARVPALYHGAALFRRLARQRRIAADHFELLLQAREAAGREPSPSAGVIDSTARPANALDQRGGRVEARAVSRGRAQYEPRIIKPDPRE